MNKIKIDISGYDEEFKKQFKNKDTTTIDELLSITENLTFEVEHLKDKIRKIENKDWEEDYIPEDY